MTKSELIAQLAERFHTLSPKDAELSANIILDTIVKHLSRGERIEIRDFGAFSTRLRPPRVGRNPKNGASVQVPAKSVPHFKPGLELRERVNKYSPSKQ
jgi:integration host factor subunit beta